MGVYIKGMKMPKHCGYCRFRYDGICHALQKTQYAATDCPLIAVPTPHGRLIDADALCAERVRNDNGVMERYTMRLPDDLGAVPVDGYGIPEIIDRLAAYEDAEEQGLLVRLPQKTVFSIGFAKGKNCDNLCPASIDGVGCCSLCDHGELIICEEECNQAHLPHIGKTVFLTREEAEAALKAKEE